MRVNAFVDAGVAGLVAALNQFPCIQTTESCESRQGAPWVCFFVEDGTSWENTATFALGYLAPNLYERVHDAADLALCPRPGGVIQINLTVRPECILDVEYAIRELASADTVGGRVSMASLAHSDDVAESVGTASRDPMQLPLTTKRRCASPGMAAVLHRTFASAASPLIYGVTKFLGWAIRHFRPRSLFLK